MSGVSEFRASLFLAFFGRVFCLLSLLVPQLIFLWFGRRFCKRALLLGSCVSVGTSKSVFFCLFYSVLRTGELYFSFGGNFISAALCCEHSMITCCV